MPLYMDVHRNKKGLTARELANAHRKDLEVQERYGVEYKSYWYNEKEGTIFCLCEAPDREAAARVHRESQGETADEIIEVKEGR